MNESETITPEQLADLDAFWRGRIATDEDYRELGEMFDDDE